MIKPGQKDCIYKISKDDEIGKSVGRKDRSVFYRSWGMVLTIFILY
jgi:hypothetical protein